MGDTNLCTQAEGLHGTQVTWEDIEKDMQRSLNTSASFGLNKSAKNIGDGKGIMSRILLVEPDWQPKNGELPDIFVAKIISELPMQELNDEVANQISSDKDERDSAALEKFWEFQKNCHNTEVDAYELIDKFVGGKIKTPMIFGSRKITESNPAKGYILMEYFENIHTVPFYENISLNQMKELTNLLRVSMEERDRFPQTPFKYYFHLDYIIEMEKQMKIVTREWLGGRFASSIDRMEEIGAELYDEKGADKLAEDLGMQRTFCHGDLWSGNMIWKLNGDHLNFYSIIDYQISHFGCAATDLVLVTCVCLSGKDRRENWEELIEVFCEFLKEEAVDCKMPFTVDQLKEAYRRFLPLGAALLVPYIGPLFGASVKDHDEKILKEVTEKAECLFEDIFLFHDRNMKIKNQAVSNAL
ncbi:hypothetical protein Q1695_003720 [Nippostrongylus brasiliensis]|nr:hypothetical protein Q1695_003720 [Nippostrongylus brasiliensis]